MPPARPRSHVNADQSISRLQQHFQSVDWTAEVLNKDYGEDLLVRIFEGGDPTPYSFFVQAKATDDITNYSIKGRQYLSYPFRVNHLENWDKFWEPVVLVIWDAINDVSYWEIAQSPERPSSTRGSKERRCYIPLDNQLNNEGIARIAARTKRRFERFENERRGASVLIDMLEEALGMKIDYDPQNGWLIVAQPDGGAKITAFGKAAERVADLQKRTGKDIESILVDSVDLYRQLADSSGIQIQDASGQIVHEWRDVNEMMRWVERRTEIQED
jgi:hypothetical protein